MVFDLNEALRAALREVGPELGEMIRRIVREEVPRATAGDLDQLLDADQAGQLIGMSAGALRRASERGSFPVEPVRIGRRVRWRRGDLVALRAERERGL